MTYFALIVEYDGTNYKGFQSQPDCLTIQDSIEESLYKLTQKNIRITSASRTDSGAHAYGQVVNFQTESDYPAEVIQNALNYHLPNDISVKRVYTVDPEFHSRKSAYSRTYRYQIINTYKKIAIYRNYYARIQQPLDENLMNQACQHLLGVHDFREIAKPTYPEGTTVRTIYAWEAERHEDKIIITCEGNGFMRYQIRKINAILTGIGSKAFPVDTIHKLLRSENPSNIQYSMLPACGLFLVGVKYHGPFSYIGE
tara:strand:+ start:14460 stop:15224 length:765 start_codon:yes stop_codon:yes gene_type:complete